MQETLRHGIIIAAVGAILTGVFTILSSWLPQKKNDYTVFSNTPNISPSAVATGNNATANVNVTVQDSSVGNVNGSSIVVLGDRGNINISQESNNNTNIQINGHSYNQ